MSVANGVFGTCRTARDRGLSVAHASCVLAMGSRHRGLPLVHKLVLQILFPRKDRFGETPKPARETRALPRRRQAERDLRFVLAISNRLVNSRRSATEIGL